jgi:hypothetical protein
MLTLAAANLPAVAQRTQPGGPARLSMERCVSDVLPQLARSQSPEARVAQAVLSGYDKQLRATLQESIRAGEVGNCTVDSCLALARSRASREATAAYRRSSRS